MGQGSAIWGPTYQEMLDPSLLPQATQQEALWAGPGAEPSAASLYNITWRDERGRVRVIKLPQELTGVEANILVLAGKYFPSGSHKVGPAYAALMEAELDGQVSPGQATLVGASTGNFGIGVAYVARLKGYQALIVMPEGTSEERCERVRRYGAEVELVPGAEGDLAPVLEQTRLRYRHNPAYRILSQFELLANYRFHRHVTGRSAIEAAAGFGDARVAAFVAAPGSAGTLAAGDEVKARFDDAVLVAVEPRECPYLFCGGHGSHRIEGIGDGVVALIHNVLNTDFVTVVPEEDCLYGLRAIQEGPGVLTRVLGVPEPAALSLVDLFGPSSVCNILGAIKVAKALRIPAGRNVVTVATDGVDRYQPLLAGLQGSAGIVDQTAIRLWAGRIFGSAEPHGLLDLRPPAEKERLLRQKQELWTRFGYDPAYLQAMQSASFWEEEYARVADYDGRLRQARGDGI